MDALSDHALFTFSVQDEELMENIEMVQTILQSAPGNDEDRALVFDAINVVEEYILGTPHTKATFAYLVPSINQLKEELSYYMAVPSVGKFDNSIVTDDEQGSMSPSSLIDPIVADEEIPAAMETSTTIPAIIRCNVCWGEESFVNDAIVICDDCDVAVHETCYGIQRIPESSWFCNFCSAQHLAPAESWEPSGECSACQLKGGALVPTHEAHKWVHMSCAIYLPELYFLHGKVDGLARLKSRRKLKCMLCKSSNKGACAQCSHAKCAASYHVQCALEHGITFHAGGNNGSVYNSLCPTHRLQPLQETPKPALPDQVPLPPQPHVQTIKQESPTVEAGTSAKIQKSIEMWLSDPRAMPSAPAMPPAPVEAAPPASHTTPVSKPTKAKLKKVPSASKPSAPAPAPDQVVPTITPTKLKSIPKDITPSSYSTFRSSRGAQVFVPAKNSASFHQDQDLVLLVLPQLPLGMDFAYADSSPLTIKDVSNPLLRSALDNGLLQKGDQLVAINNISLKGVTLTQLTHDILPQCAASQSAVQCWFRKASLDSTKRSDDMEWPWGYLRSDGKLAMVLVWQEMADLYYSHAAAKPAMAHIQDVLRDKSPWTVPSLGYTIPPVVRRHRRKLAQELTAINAPLPPLDEGDMVQVAARTWPGINKLGGAGRIKAKHATAMEGVFLYDVSYVLGGGEKGVERQYITPVTADNPVNITPSDSIDDAERWTIYVEFREPSTAHPRPRATANSDGFALKFQQLVVGDDVDNAQLEEIADRTATKGAGSFRTIAVNSVEGEDDVLIGDDEVLKQLRACQAQLNEVESVAQQTLAVFVDKLATEKKLAYGKKLDRVMATQYENMYREMLKLQDDDMDSSDEEDDEDVVAPAPMQTETIKDEALAVKVEPSSGDAELEDDDDEPLNPLFASISETATETCVMCCMAGGDLAATSCGNKAHIMCLLYTPETYFDNSLGHGIPDVSPERSRLVCDLCKKSTGINKIQCNSKKCTKPMHVQCAYVAGLLTTLPTFCGWCPRHFKLTDAATQASVDLPPHLQKKRKLQDESAAAAAPPSQKTPPRPKVKKQTQIFSHSKPTPAPVVANPLKLLISTLPTPVKQPRHLTQAVPEPEPAAPSVVEEFNVGQTVDVHPRLWSGMNKPGGVGRVKAKHVDANGDATYDIEYVLGSREKGVPGVYLTRYIAEPTAGPALTTQPSKKRRRSTLSK